MDKQVSFACFNVHAFLLLIAVDTDQGSGNPWQKFMGGLGMPGSAFSMGAFPGYSGFASGMTASIL